MKILSFAKINLCLDILKKDASGYHEIQTVLYEYKDIFDVVSIVSAKDHDEMSMVNGKNGRPLKRPVKLEENLAYKALLLVKKEFKIKKFVQILIKKNIPVSSGFGGASSNAASMLKGLNKLWKLRISQIKLLKMAGKLGMDVPFFIIGGTALATNFGEKVKALKPIKNLKIKIFPKSSALKNKTKDAYAKIKIENCGKEISKTSAIVKAINGTAGRGHVKAGHSKSGNGQLVKTLIENCHNDFETIFSVKSALAKSFKKGRRLNGAGPSTFEIIN